MGRAFTHYWTSDTWEGYRGRDVTYTASNIFRKRSLKPGDRIFIVSNIDGHLRLGAAMDVRRVVGRAEAKRILGREVWKGKDFAIARKAVAFNADRQVSVNDARSLRFLPDGDGLKFTGGKLNQQTLRGLRELMPESAALLEKVVASGRSGRALSGRSTSTGKPFGVPPGITRQDVLSAIAAISSRGAGAQFGKSRNWDVLVDGQPYPPKKVIGVAASRLEGRELIPGDFQSGEDSRCNRTLAELGFAVVHKGDRTVAKEEAEEEAEVAILQRTDIGETEKLCLTKARRGQSIYRNNLEMIEKGCRVTGVSDGRYLRASHIKPWVESSDFEKLDGNNGLLLSPHVDHLFDGGWLSFSDEGEVLVAKSLDSKTLKAWGIDTRRSVGTFRKEQRVYLAWHRKRYGFGGKGSE